MSKEKMTQDDTAPVEKKKMIGQSVLVKHRSVSSKSGAVQMKACSKGDSTEQFIKAVYRDGSVRTNTGDVWDVRPAKTGNYDWETVATSDT